MLGAERAATQRERDRDRELDQTMVDQRLSAFDTSRHRGAIDLRQDVVGHVVMHIPQAQLLAWRARVNVSKRSRRLRFSDQTPELGRAEVGPRLIEHFADTGRADAVADLT